MKKSQKNKNQITSWKSEAESRESAVASLQLAINKQRTPIAPIAIGGNNKQYPMPHITLEYSSNIRITKDFGTLFGQIHLLLERSLKVNPLNCKCRAICHDNFFIADGDKKHAFAHLQIKVLDKHPLEGKHAVGSGAFEMLREFFKDEVDGLCFQPSVEIHEMKGDLYYKLAMEEILNGDKK